MCPEPRFGGSGRRYEINELNESEPSFREYYRHQEAELS